jgi:hypothetical protein
MFGSKGVISNLQTDTDIMQFILKNSKIMEDTLGETQSFPKYTTQIMNLAN